MEERRAFLEAYSDLADEGTLGMPEAKDAEDGDEGEGPYSSASASDTGS